MGREYAEIDGPMRAWVEAQRVFFVSTAPRADDGRINCSPKGLDSLRILGPRQLAYGDTGGSGIETVAHLKENGRIVIMLCAFEGAPKILRFYGRGRVLEPRDEGFVALARHFSHLPALRNVVVIDVQCIRDACGYGVPKYSFVGERDTLHRWIASKSDDEMEEYRRKRNEVSLDGLPGLDLEAPRTPGGQNGGQKNGSS